MSEPSIFDSGDIGRWFGVRVVEYTPPTKWQRIWFKLCWPYDEVRYWIYEWLYPEEE